RTRRATCWASTTKPAATRCSRTGRRRRTRRSGAPPRPARPQPPRRPQPKARPSRNDAGGMNVIKDTGKRALLPPFTEEHEELRESVRNFVSKEIAPHVEEWEEAREFPRELYDRCGELGFIGLKYETEYGGQGGDYVHDAVWVEE